jgi:hypothetical protein
MTGLPGTQEGLFKAEGGKVIESYISGKIPEGEQARKLKNLRAELQEVMVVSLALISATSRTTQISKSESHSAVPRDREPNAHIFAFGNLFRISRLNLSRILLSWSVIMPEWPARP